MVCLKDVTASSSWLDELVEEALKICLDDDAQLADCEGDSWTLKPVETISYYHLSVWPGDEQLESDADETCGGFYFSPTHANVGPGITI